MAKKSISKGVIKDIVIVGIGVLVIWIGLQVAFGTQNPFYVVASGSMIPVLEVYDVLIVQGHEPFEEIEVGDIIVFNRPSDHNRVIVHRVASILDDDPRTLRTKGDANPASIPGTDFPITAEEYIGKVAYTLPQVGYVTQLLKPPINYVIIAVVIGIMVAKQMAKRKKEEANVPFSPKTETETLDEPSEEAKEELSDLNEMEMDSEYSEVKENSDVLEEIEKSVESKDQEDMPDNEPEKDNEEEKKE
ncbi:signal peptidase I [Nitrosopumilus sp.]|uniref:signal peptidase I n=1 Tax=Nitrosopumilus sp. TaxID=2024843 RepID=UPI002627CAA4|nr:signal peptidase I [Nitrosopumilus sp.]